MSTRRVSVSIFSQSSTDARDDGSVLLRVEDDASGECLAHVEMPAGRWWRLCQGSTQHHDALISDHLDRVGKKMEMRLVTFGPDFGRDDRPEERDIYRAATDQHPDFLDYQEAMPRRTNRGWDAILRRWAATDA